MQHLYYPFARLMPIRGRLLTFLTAGLFLLLGASFVIPTASAHSLRSQSGGGAVIYVHTTTTANSAGDYTQLNNIGFNNDPNAVIEVTPNWNPGGIGGVYDNHPIGVFYSGGYWYIFNQDYMAIPVGAAFNVYAVPVSSDSGYEGAIISTATAANSAYDYTIIDNASLNNQPAMRILVTPNWNPPGHNGVYNNHPIGVFYLPNSGKWAIFNQDLAAISVGASFNINFSSTIVAGTFVDTATSSNSLGDYTCLDAASANNNPSAHVFATSNWNPNGFGVYNNHNTGVFYNVGQGHWCVFNQDYAAIPIGVAFNIYVL